VVFKLIAVEKSEFSEMVDLTYQQLVGESSEETPTPEPSPTPTPMPTPTMAPPSIDVVVPNSNDFVEANFASSAPFSLISPPTMRYQQVYLASEFSYVPGPHDITRISFCPDALGGAPFSSSIATIQINLSTTSKTPGDLSATFIDNVGVDDTVVFSGALPLSSSATGPPAGPKDFDIVIDLGIPFSYNPSDGNLLLDVRNFTGGVTTVFDARDFVTGGPSPVFARVWGSVGDTTGATDTGTQGVGLVTKFAFLP
jgi:hypothetical protein